MKDEWGVIFDVDGVLVDSYEAHLRSWQMLGAERGFSFTETRFVETFGRTTREIIRENLDRIVFERGDRGPGRPQGDLVSRTPRTRFPGHGRRGCACLMTCIRRAISWAPVSSGPPENVRLVLDLLGRADCFRGLVTGMDVTRGKPDPAGVLDSRGSVGIGPLPLRRDRGCDGRRTGREAGRDLARRGLRKSGPSRRRIARGRPACASPVRTVSRCRRTAARVVR